MTEIIRAAVAGLRGPGLTTQDTAYLEGLVAGVAPQVAEATTQAGNSAASAGQAQIAQQETEEALAAANITAITQPDGSSSWGIEDPIGGTLMRVLADGEVLLRGGRRLNDTLDKALAASDSISFVTMPDGSPAQRFEDRIGQSLYLNGERPARTAPLPNGFSITDQWRYNDQIAADPIAPQGIPVLTSSNAFWPEGMRGTTSHVRIPTVAVGGGTALFACEGRIGGPQDDRPNRIIVRDLPVASLAAIDFTRDYTAALMALKKQYELLVDPNEASTSHTFVDPVVGYDSVAHRHWVITAHKPTTTTIGVYSDDNCATWKGAGGAALALPIAPAAAVQMPQIGAVGALSPTHAITTREGVFMFPFRRGSIAGAGPDLVMVALNRESGQFEIILTVPGNDPALFGGMGEVAIAQCPKTGYVVLNSRRGGGVANRLIVRLAADGRSVVDSWIDEALVDIEASGGMLAFSSHFDAEPDRLLFSNCQSNDTATDGSSRYNLGVKISYDGAVRGAFRGKGPIWPRYDVAYRDALGAPVTNLSLVRGTGYSDMLRIDAGRFGVFYEGNNMFAGRSDAAWHHSLVLSILNFRSILA